MECKKGRLGKKFMVWAALALFLFLTVAAVFLTHFSYVFDKGVRTHEVTGSKGAFDKFYEARFGIPIEENEFYEKFSELDRSLHYKNGNLTVTLTDDNTDSVGNEVLFFKDYFKSLSDGDADSYNRLFSKNYLSSHESHAAFAPQMIYDILVEKISSADIGGASSYTFHVSYKIYKNDGTFRNDIYSDASRTLQIVIDSSEGNFKISDLKYFVS